MSLIENTRPAERERGCVWASGFRTASEVREDGGTLSGTPTFDATQGMTFDGSTDYITYSSNAVSQKFYKSSTVSIVIEFTPTFALNDNNIHVLFDSTNGQRYAVNKGAANTLTILLGNTIIESIAYETISAVWRASARNILVITSTSGDTSAWLNGTQVLTDDATAWSVASPTNTYVGCRYDNATLFQGTIHKLMFFTKQLSDQEALDYSNGGRFWNYLNVATNYWPLDLANLANDVIGSQDGTVNSATKNTYKPGYTFDGTDDSITVGSNITIGTNDYSVVALVRCNTGVNSYDGILGSSGAGGAGLCLPLYLTNDGTSFRTHLDASAYTSTENMQIGDNLWHVVAVSADRSGNAEFFIDGDSKGTVDISGKSATSVTVENPAIGDVSGAEWYGDIAHVFFWNGKALTNMQVKDASIKLLNKINDL